MKAPEISIVNDSISDIEVALTKAFVIQQKVAEDYFGKANIENEREKIELIKGYEYYGVFAEIVSDNLSNIRALLEDLRKKINQ